MYFRFNKNYVFTYAVLAYILGRYNYFISYES